MQAIFQSLVAVILILFSSIIHAAQPNFFVNLPQATPSANQSPAATVRRPAVTPEQFKQGINKVSQQTDKNLTDQIDKKLVKSQPLPPPPPAPTASSDSSNFSIENQPAAAPQQTQQPAYNTQQPAATIQPLQSQRPPAPAVTPSAPAQGRGSYYQGFGTSNSPSNNAGGNQGQSQGWDIKY